MTSSVPEAPDLSANFAELSISDNKSAESNATDKSKSKRLSLETLAESIKSGRCKNVLMMVGAGISVSAVRIVLGCQGFSTTRLHFAQGIPDFRTPGTG